jgi:hypothetical protein
MVAAAAFDHGTVLRLLDALRHGGRHSGHQGLGTRLAG